MADSSLVQVCRILFYHECDAQLTHALLGHFGLTPVVVTGSVSTRAPALSPPLLVNAVNVTVRCVETRLGGPFGSAPEHVLFEKTRAVWSAKDGPQVLGDWTSPFRITIPLDAAKVAVSSQHLKKWKVVWRFEASVEHKPIPYVGCRIVKAFFLNILNHAVPPQSPPSPPTDMMIGSGPSSTLVHLSTPHGAFGPGDEINLSFTAKTQDPQTMIKRATLVLERVAEFLDDTEVKPLVTASVTDIESRTSVTLVMPRRGSAWDVGETVRTDTVVLRYQLRLHLAIQTDQSRQVNEYSCPAISLHVSSTSKSERDGAKPVAKRHRSSRRGLYMHEGTVDISSPLLDAPVQRSSFVAADIPAGLKPILLPPDHPAQPNPIHFIFPSPPPGGTPLRELPDYDSYSIIRQFQQNGRRISTTGSEEEAMQPSRSRQKLVERPTLPSLDALGLGLPHVERRPVTAPTLRRSHEMEDPRPSSMGQLCVPSGAQFAFK